MSMRRVLVLLAAVTLGFAGASALRPSTVARAAPAAPMLSSDAAVTVYGASWCSACKSLERGLRDRSVPFDLVDVDQNPKAYEVAKRATGKNVVPITSVSRGSDELTWIVGADVDAVEKAYRGE